MTVYGHIMKPLMFNISVKFQIFHIENQIQVINYFSEILRGDNSRTGKVRGTVINHNM